MDIIRRRDGLRPELDWRASAARGRDAESADARGVAVARPRDLWRRQCHGHDVPTARPREVPRAAVAADRCRSACAPIGAGGAQHLGHERRGALDRQPRGAAANQRADR